MQEKLYMACSSVKCSIVAQNTVLLQIKTMEGSMSSVGPKDCLMRSALLLSLTHDLSNKGKRSTMICAIMLTL